MRKFLPALLLLATALRAAEPSATAYLFAYFVKNGQDGLHLAAGADGYAYEPLKNGESFLTPVVGESKLMRDPCLLRGPDGTFHLIWTTSWEGKTIGYASSKDLKNWSEQKALPVMAHEPAARNCWAPEVAYDDEKQEFVIFWSTTITGKFPETQIAEDKGYNHRIYATTTKDFETFTPTRLFYEPGFNVIDATLLRDGPRWRLIVKDETRVPVKKHLRVATSDHLGGPYTDLSAPFTRDWVEGPTAVKIGDDFVVFYDCYRDKHYGAVRTKDFKTWENITDKIKFPPGARHGAIIEVPTDLLATLRTSQETK